jgi:hypothetical protein
MTPLHKKLTSKEAIKGADKTAAIKSYCAWCMNDLLVHQCSCAGCAIHKYRAQPTVALKINFEDEKTRAGLIVGEAKRTVDSLVTQRKPTRKNVLPAEGGNV